jgi:hexulose-6-phosphate isomerase
VKLGIMQGRLLPPEGGKFQSFPRIRWREEFALAAAAELDSIEWIYDSYGEDVNPLTTDAGVSELERLCVANAIGVKSVCADWFMDFPLTSVDSQSSVRRWDRLRWLMTRCGPLGINRIVVPFVDASAIRSPEETSAVVAGINSLGASIDATNVEIHLETTLSPKDFAALLSRLEHPRVKVNYDAGNSASLGYLAREEFAAYGGRVGSVHLKDRIRGGGTVPLGLGDTDFEELFACLKSVGYNGDFILQVARGVEGDELAWTRGNVAMARQMIGTLRQT